MKYDIDISYLLQCLKDLVAAPSPSGLSIHVVPVLRRYAEDLGLSVTTDNKDTVYLTLEGRDNSKPVLLSAHADTLGMAVRGTDTSSGGLGITVVGQPCVASTEGQSVTVHTRSGKTYSGILYCKSHSVHVFRDARTRSRTEDDMMVVLDEDVKTKAELDALGIRNGDYISVDPDFEVTENGYVKSRYLDDKAAIACIFAMLKCMKDKGLQPAYRTVLAFPHWEEMGFGGSFVPEGVSEYVAVDIGLIGPDNSGSERAVTVCARDGGGHYDYDLTNRLMACAERAEAPYSVDNILLYNSDARAAVRAGHDLRIALCGMAVWGSHGRERTHVEGLKATANLLTEYVVNG